MTTKTFGVGTRGLLLSSLAVALVAGCGSEDSLQTDPLLLPASVVNGDDFTIMATESAKPGTWNFRVEPRGRDRGGVTEFEWDFGSGEVVSGSEQSFSFNEPGLHVIVVTGLDATGRALFVLTLELEIADTLQAPIVAVGDDFFADENTLVFLDGSSSFDPNDEELTFFWTQIAGPPVFLTDAATPIASFVAPSVTEDVRLVFKLVVDDGTYESEASLAVDVIDLLSGAGIEDSNCLFFVEVLDASLSDPDGGPRPLTVEATATSLSANPAGGTLTWRFDDDIVTELWNDHAGMKRTFTTVGIHTITLAMTIGASTISCQSIQSGTSTARVEAWPFISGDVRDDSGNPISGVTVSANEGGRTAVSSADGTYKVAVPYSWTGRITAQHAGYSFNNPSRLFNAVKTDLLEAPFVALSPANPPPPDGATNVAPVAVASGPGAPLVDSDGDGVATAVLDGSRSHDPDGAVATYAWFRKIAGAWTEFAGGASAQVDLSVGDHLIHLVVTDNKGLASPPSLEMSISVVACSGDNHCSNGVFCDGIERCINNTCQQGTTPCSGQLCNDTTDACEAIECSIDADCADAKFCNGAETCLAGRCVNGSDPCPGQACDEVTNSCVACLADSDCANSLFCDGSEVCVSGSCVSGTPPCTGAQPYCVEGTDSCAECEIHSQCSNNLYCDGVEQCVSGVCQDGADPCSANICDEGTDTCTECTSNSDCPDDGVFCNGTESCVNNSCVSSGSPCSAGELCTESTTDCTPVVGNIYYVATNDPNANDSNTGTESSPFKTINGGVKATAAGDTVIIKAGTYPEWVALRGNREATGLPGAPITLQSENWYPGAAHDRALDVILTGDGVRQFVLSISSEQQYITIRGLIVEKSANKNISLGSGVQYITIEDCIARDAITDGINVVGSGPTVHDIIIRRCIFSGNGNAGLQLRGIEGISNVLVDECDSYRNGALIPENAQGFAARTPISNLLFRKCIAYENLSSSIGAVDPTDLTIDDCVAWGTTSTGDAEGRSLVIGLHGGASRAILRRSVSFDNPMAGVMLTNAPTTTTYGITVFDNGFQRPGENTPGSRNGVTVDNTDLIIRNVCTFDNAYDFDGNPDPGSHDFNVGTVSNLDSDYNLVMDGFGMSHHGPNSFTGAPQLTDKLAARQLADDYAAGNVTRQYFLSQLALLLRPAPGSPLIDAGGFSVYTTSAGSNTTVIPVNRDPQRFFRDGIPTIGVAADLIQIDDGDGIPGTMVRTRIVSMTANSITVETPVSFGTGSGIHMPYTGNAPDIGAYEAE